MRSSADGPPPVVVDGLCKSFRLPKERVHTLKERALHPLRRSRFERLEALTDVSFAVESGEFLGIVGRNGSGKSTLLKCLAGIYRADRGSIYMNGRVSTFIELGVGFNPDLAARDNVTLNAIMLGLTPNQAAERFDRVIEFAGLEKFVDLKLKNYSSGMHVRLAFAVMVQVDADILLIDEVLAVGDAAFQQKCFDAFADMRAEGRTIILVTHDTAAVTRFCDRAILLERGEIRLIDKPERVVNHYIELNFGRDAGTPAGEEAEGGERFGSQEGRLLEAWFEDEHGERQTILPQGRPCTFRVRACFRTGAEDPAIAVAFENDRQDPLFATSTWAVEKPTGIYAPGDEVIFSVSFQNPFAPGRIYASPWLTRGPGLQSDLMDRRPRMASVIVTGVHNGGGLIDVPHDVSLEHAGSTLSGRAFG